MGMWRSLGAILITWMLMTLGGVAYSKSLDPLKILRITPEGADAAEANQIIIEFDRPMVIIGQQNGADLPAKITPAIKGEWRWLNDKTLSFNNSEEGGFKKATQYTVTLETGLKALDGASLQDQYSHHFTTFLPRSTWNSLVTWEAPGRPVLEVNFNQPIKKESLESHLYFVSTNALSRKIKVKASSRVFDDQGNLKPDLKVASSWTVKPSQDLSLSEDYELKSEPGIEAEEGSERSNESIALKTFKTFGEFNLLGFRCRTNEQKSDEEPVLFTSAAPQKSDQRCNPMAPIELVFTSPVLRSQLQKNIQVTPDPTAGKKNINWWQVDDEEYSQLNWGADGSSPYPQWLPGGLKAATDYTISLPFAQQTWWQKFKQLVLGLFWSQPQTELEDEFGRKLKDPFSLKILLDDRKPNFVLPTSTVVLEKHADSEAPFFVNNLKKLQFNYNAVTIAGVLEKQLMEYEVAYVKNIQYAIPGKIREMLKGKAGAVYGTITTDPTFQSGEDVQKPALFAQVTPYQVQVKMGHFKTLVWVTDLATGEVVPGAKVSVYPGTLSGLGQPSAILATATTNEQGIAFLPGQESLDPKKEYSYAWRPEDKKLFVRVDKGNDMALLYLKDPFEIDMWRASGSSFSGWNQSKYDHLMGWGITAQGVYRAGDKVEYKIYLRNQSNDHLVPPPAGKYDLAVFDPLGKVIHEVKDLKLDRVGSYFGDFSTPKTAPVGWYTFEIKAYMPDMVKESGADPQTGKLGTLEPTVRLSPFRVLISDFTPSSFKVETEVNGEIFKPEQDIIVSVLAKLHAGGAYTDAKAELNAFCTMETFTSRHPLAEKFSFGEPVQDWQAVFTEKGKLDAKGELKTSHKIPPQRIFYGNLIIEGKVYDDRGSSVSSRKVVKYIGGDQLVGLQQKEWLLQAEKSAEIGVIVVNEQGEPIAGKVDIKVEREEISTAKVKSAGNVYQTHANKEWVELTKNTLDIKAAPAVYTFTPLQAGSYRVTATTTDSKNRTHTSLLEAYVTGSSFVPWGEESDTYLPLIPEKKEYKVGEIARFLVKNPYPKATALITVERFGILDSFVQTLSSNTPVIEIPIKPDYSPNFFVSVTAMVPRADHKPLEVGQLDLGKPAYRMGYAKIKVKDHYKELLVAAEPVQKVYKPRDKVRVNLKASLKNPARTGEHSEPIDLAVVVVDEAVFALNSQGRSYYDPYTGFYKEEELDMTNYSLLNGLVGRMKFEKKGATSGGDGGVDPSLRNLFKFVSYWNPSVELDEKGQATIEFEAPDNITGWRVLAIAVTPTDQMGLGEGTFKVNRPTEIRPVMPNQIAEGDEFKAGFSVMNRTDKARQIKVSIEASGTLDKESFAAKHEKIISLDPYKRATVDMPLKVGRISGNEEGEIKFKVTAGDELDHDKTEYKLPALRLRALESQGMSGTLTASGIKIPVSIPDKIYTDVGGISVTLSPTVISNIAGAFKYMKDYPFTCWEQKLSRALTASYYKDLEKYIGKEVTWPDSETFVKEILKEVGSFQADNGGLGYFLGQDAYVDPFLSAFTAVGFAWLHEQGYEIPPGVEEKLLGYLDGLMKKDFPEAYYTPEMVSNTRALILEALAYRQKATLQDLERVMGSLEKMNLFGQSSFARAAMNTKGGKDIAFKVVASLISHFNETSSQLSKSTVSSALSARMLDSSLRESCSVLETLSQYGHTSEGEKLIGDRAIKLAKTISEARKSKLHWENTQENMYCTRALAAYSKAYEAEASNMKVSVTKEDQPLGKAHFTEVVSSSAEIKSPLHPTDLGRLVNIQITKEGSGRLYYKTLLQYAPQNLDPKAVNAGLNVRREYSVLRNNSWLLLKDQPLVQKGELVRVDLYLTAPGDRTFIVVNDPVPGGLEPVSKDLATASESDQKRLEGKPAEGAWWYSFKDWVEFGSGRWAFYHQELRHDAVRFYADYLPEGSYHLSYVAQVIGEGKFTASPAVAQEMYNPETYGRGEPMKLQVGNKG